MCLGQVFQSKRNSAKKTARFGSLANNQFYLALHTKERNSEQESSSGVLKSPRAGCGGLWTGVWSIMWYRVPSPLLGSLCNGVACPHPTMENDHLHVYISANLAVIPQGRLCPPKEGTLVVLAWVWCLSPGQSVWLVWGQRHPGDITIYIFLF